MALNLYRRHRLFCEGGHPEDSRSGQFDERRKGWRLCHCLIYVSGMLGGRFRRRCTEHSRWAEALDLAASLEAVGAWDSAAPRPSAPADAGPALAPPSPPEPAPSATGPPLGATPPRVSIADAIDLYKTMKRATVAPSTFRKHRTLTKQLAAFATARLRLRRRVHPHQHRRLLRDERARSALQGERLETLRGFFRFCVNREWLTKSPVSPDLKPPRGSTRPVNKMPFTDEQLADIIEACDQLE